MRLLGLIYELIEIKNSNEIKLIPNQKNLGLDWFIEDAR